MEGHSDQVQRIGVGETARFEGGVEIEWARNDPSAHTLKFEVRKGPGPVRTVVVKGVSTLLAEGRAFGETFSLRKLDGRTVEARILAEPPEPLSDERAMALARQFVEEAGMSSPSVIETWSSRGVVWLVFEQHHRGTAHVEVGVYSHQVMGKVDRDLPMHGPPQ